MPAPQTDSRGWLRDFLWQTEEQKKKRWPISRWINGPLGLAILGGAFLFVGGRVAQSSLKQTELVKIAASRLEPKDAVFMWPENTTVLASTMQEDVSREEFFSLNSPSLYSQKLFGALAESGTADLYEAQRKIEGGFASLPMRLGGMAQVPVSSTVHVPGWKKGEDKPRYVLMISGYGIDGSTINHVGDNDKYELEKQILIDASYVKHQLQKQYGIKDEKIRHLVQPAPTEIFNALKELEKQVAFAPGAEVLIYLTGHGSLVKDSRYVPSGKRHLQGAEDGDIRLTDSSSIGEWDLKEFLKRRLGNAASVYVVVNSCHSGAWIASTGQQPHRPVDAIG